jgi:hypothetical protein
MALICIENASIHLRIYQRFQYITKESIKGSLILLYARSLYINTKQKPEKFNTWFKSSKYVLILITSY